MKEVTLSELQDSVDKMLTISYDMHRISDHSRCPLCHRPTQVEEMGRTIADNNGREVEEYERVIVCTNDRCQHFSEPIEKESDYVSEYADLDREEDLSPL